MKISIASGKGGTGKTTVAVSMALALRSHGLRVQLLDADVEEPNSLLFLDDDIAASEDFGIMVPTVDREACTSCRACRDLCAYNAIKMLGGSAMVFPELCHGCGGCIRVCPDDAISEALRPVGVIEGFDKDGFVFRQGKLNIGEVLSTPIIRELLHRDAPQPVDVTLVDASPGTSCPVIAACNPSDFVLLVTEPTPFGLNDLALAVEMVRELKKPCGVVVNRAGLGNDVVHRYCEEQGVEIMMEIPFDRTIAEQYSRGTPLVTAKPEMTEAFVALYDRIKVITGGGQ